MKTSKFAVYKHWLRVVPELSPESRQ